MSFDKKKYAQIVSKDWELEKETKVNSEFLSLKSSKKYFILLPTF